MDESGVAVEVFEGVFTTISSVAEFEDNVATGCCNDCTYASEFVIAAVVTLSDDEILHFFLESIFLLRNKNVLIVGCWAIISRRLFPSKNNFRRVK